MRGDRPGAKVHMVKPDAFLRTSMGTACRNHLAAEVRSTTDRSRVTCEHCLRNMER